MTGKDRTNCPIAYSAQLVADQWIFLILREFFLDGPQKFQTLQDVLGASPNTLSSRLKRLENSGLIERRFYSQNPPRAEYHLTEKGLSFAPVMTEIRKWGARQISND